jgi:hypothetical protein
MHFNHDTNDITVTGGAVKINGLSIISSYSSIWVHTANGYGSTNTMIRRFTTVQQNIGTDITYTDSATLGALFTINASGIYAISFSDQFNAGTSAGISLNTTTPTTSIGSIAANERLSRDTSPAADTGADSSVILYLAAGSLIRPHTAGVPSGTVPACTKFNIVRVF